jgi:hypothetical protein
MPQSKKRHHPHPQQHHTTDGKPTINKSGKLVNAGIIFFALLGLGISFFIAGPSIVWLIIGAVVGGVAGYFFAREMSKTLSKK